MRRKQSTFVCKRSLCQSGLKTDLSICPPPLPHTHTHPHTLTQDFDDWDDVGLNIPKPPDLLYLFRNYSTCTLSDKEKIDRIKQLVRHYGYKYVSN